MKQAKCCICGVDIEVKPYTPANKCMCPNCKQNRKQDWQKNKITSVKTEIDNLQPKQKGNCIELAVMLEALKRNIRVSVPYGDNSDYDQIWDIKGKLYKVQVKYAAKLSNGSYRINMQHGIYCDGKLTSCKYDSESVDIFASMVDDKCIIIPSIKSCKMMTFRITEPANKQSSGINWVNNYLFDNWLQTI